MVSATLRALIGAVILSLLPTTTNDSQAILAASSAPLEKLLQALRSVKRTLFSDRSNSLCPLMVMTSPGDSLPPSWPKLLWLQVFVISIASWWLAREASNNCSETGIGVEVPSKAIERTFFGYRAAKFNATNDPML